MENQKIALVTGVTGGIGKAFAELLTENNYIVFAPVRNISKAYDIFGDNPLITFEECNLEDYEVVLKYIQNAQKEGVIFDLVVLSAGAFAWDKDFVGKDLKEIQKNAEDALTVANFLTKETFALALDHIYKEELKKTKLVLISSQAAKFSEEDIRRNGEEGYVNSMQKVSELGQKLADEGLFAGVILEEPGLIDTELARKEFTLETIGEEIDWTKISKPKEYVSAILEKFKLI